MRRTLLRTATAFAIALGLAAPATPAQADEPRRVVRTASTGFTPPDGATLVGTVSAPAGLGARQIDLGPAMDLVPKGPALPCVARQAWALSGTALTGSLYTWTDVQTGQTSADVMWVTDDGDWDPEDGEGLVAYASADCAQTLLVEWTLLDTSPWCMPWATGATNIEDETPGPITEPVYYIFGVGWIPYFSFDPSLGSVPCLRAQSTIVFQARVSYVEKNRGTKVPIGCVQRSWPVTFAPRVGDDPTKPSVSWLTVGAASPEEAC